MPSTQFQYAYQRRRSAPDVSRNVHVQIYMKISNQQFLNFLDRFSLAGARPSLLLFLDGRYCASMNSGSVDEDLTPINSIDRSIVDLVTTVSNPPTSPCSVLARSSQYWLNVPQNCYYCVPSDMAERILLHYFHRERQNCFDALTFGDVNPTDTRIDSILCLAYQVATEKVPFIVMEHRIYRRR